MLLKYLVGPFVAATVVLSGCGSTPNGTDDGGGNNPDLSRTGVDGGTPCTGTAAACAAAWEDNASLHFQSVLTTPTELTAFLAEVPKGGDLHNHLTGAVYAETCLDWAQIDGDCINMTTFSVGGASSCSATNLPAPSSGPFFDNIVRAWSMQDFVPSPSQSGHNHFFATFGKFGLIAGAHRDDSIADLARRASDENQLYVETMFNMGKNVSTLASSVWTSTTPPAAGDLDTFYTQLVGNAGFAAAVNSDVAVINAANSGWKSKLGCAGSSPPSACQVQMRFIAQVARTGTLEGIFGQLVSAFEMAAKTPYIVAANLSSPEDDATSLKNYDVQMAMLDYLHNKYTVPKTSPLHITLHAGELVPKYLPTGSTANTFHIRHAVETGHAERIGHGIDILSETDSSGLMDEMRDKNVLVEVCLASNDQILEVSGTNHPLSQYLSHNVPVALATDDQGVSRSSLAGEYARAAKDQMLTYRQLKTIARNSLEHAFIAGASLWSIYSSLTPSTECATTATMIPGSTPDATCQAFLDANDRAKLQWELEKRFLAFESQQ